MPALNEAGTPMTTDRIITALNGAKLAAQLSKGQEALLRSPRKTVCRPDGADPRAPVPLYEDTDLNKIMKRIGLKPLPPVGNKNELARCLKTCFDGDKEVLGATYEF